MEEIKYKYRTNSRQPGRVVVIREDVCPVCGGACESVSVKNQDCSWCKGKGFMPVRSRMVPPRTFQGFFESGRERGVYEKR